MKIEQITEFAIVDRETGEIVKTESSRTYSRPVSIDTFYMVFIEHMAPYYKLKNNAKNILTWMCNHAEFNTGIVYLTTAARKRMAEEADICVNTITNNLEILKKAGLIAGEDGEFVINPMIFWKGDLKTREQLLKDNTLQIQFSLVPITQDGGSKKEP